MRPNFHFGFRTAGWLHDDTAPAELARYLEYWRSHIDDHHQRPAEDWPAILEELAREQIVSRDYLSRFANEVGRRTPLSPRPGLLITRSWPLTDAEHLDQRGELASAIRDATDHALAVMGDPAL